MSFIGSNRRVIAVVSALSIMIVPSIIPAGRTPPRPPRMLKAKQVSDLRPEDKTRRDVALRQLVAEGFRVGTTTTTKYTASLSRESSRHWSALWSAHAEDYSDSNAYVSVTVLDDGDPNTFEFWAYVHEYSGGGESWGVVQGLISDPGGAWVFDEGNNGLLARNLDDRPSLLAGISPTLQARPDWCDRGFDTRTALKNALVSGLAAGASGVIYNPECWAGGFAGVGACFGAGFLSGFGWNLAYGAFDYTWRCWA